MIAQILTYDHFTVLLYCGLVLFSTFFAAISQTTRWSDTGEWHCETRKVPYILSFCLLAFFACTTSVGADRISYTNFFLNSTMSNLATGIEPGFQLMMSIFRTMTSNAALFLGVVSFLTVFNVYKGLWYFRETISLGFAIFVFSSQYYLQSYNLMRIYFAISILILFAHFIAEEKYFKYFLVLCFACCFHYSIIFVCIAYILAMMLKRLKDGNMSLRVVLLMILVVILCIALGRYAVVLLSFSSTLSSKYSAYTSNMYSAKYGLKWLANTIPYLTAIALAKYSKYKKQFLNITLCYMLVVVAVSLLNYSIPVVGRAVNCLNMPIIVFLSLGLNEARQYCKLNNTNRIAIHLSKYTILVPIGLVKNILYLFFLYMFVLYLYEYIPSDQIDNFSFFWN